MINPIFLNIINLYQWLSLGIFVAILIDWSFGFDKLITIMNKMIYLFDDLPSEAIIPLILTTSLGCFCKLMEILIDPIFFGTWANIFGIFAIGYIILLVLTVLILVVLKILTTLRNTSIARRAEKSRKKP